jgi:hypothetical protein
VCRDKEKDVIPSSICFGCEEGTNHNWLLDTKTEPSILNIKKEYNIYKYKKEPAPLNMRVFSKLLVLRSLPNMIPLPQGDLSLLLL